jgi:outer membrane lipoprotein SlyB
MKKIGSVILIMALGVWGCVSVDHSTVVDTNTSGYASGQFRDVRQGTVANFGIFGGRRRRS